MRVECESCGKLVTTTFAVDTGALRGVCPACGASITQSVAPPGQPASEPPASSPGCPKCGAPRRDDVPACPSCGLSAANAAAFIEVRDSFAPPDVQAAWQTVFARWEDDAGHDALFQLIAHHGCYAWAAARYRHALRERPADPVAPRQLERLRRAAEAALRATAAVRPDQAATPYRSTIAILAMLVIAIVVGLFYAMVVRGRESPPDREPSPMPTESRWR